MRSMRASVFLVERDHPFGVELAERDLEPGAVARGSHGRSRARGRAARRCAARRPGAAAVRRRPGGYCESRSASAEPPVGVDGQITGQAVVGRRGMSERKISSPRRCSSHPHSVMSARKLETAMDPSGRSATVIGSPVLVLSGSGQRVEIGLDVATAVQSASDVKPGSTAARNRPKWANRVARLRDRFGPAGAALALEVGRRTPGERGRTSAMRSSRAWVRPRAAAGLSSDAEVEQHAAGRRVSADSVVPPALAGAPLPRRAGAGAAPRSRRRSGRRGAGRSGSAAGRPTGTPLARPGPACEARSLSLLRQKR